MTTEEIQDYINRAIRGGFKGVKLESGEVMTSEGGDGRFLGKVMATRYGGLPERRDLFLAIGKTDKKVQVFSRTLWSGVPCGRDGDVMGTC